MKRFSLILDTTCYEFIDMEDAFKECITTASFSSKIMNDNGYNINALTK